MAQENKVDQFLRIIEESDNIVFFGGAGVSTESGIPDFRSVDGLYNLKYDYPPEEIISHSFFYENTAEFYRFYREKILLNGIKPNVTHIKLAELEKKGKLKAIVTQNIDGLHQAAGSREVLELHGTVAKNRCLKCGKRFGQEKIISYIDDALERSGQKASEINRRPDSQEGYQRMKYTYDMVPKCDSCGGIIKPEVVLYEEGLDDYVVEKSINYISNADVLIVGGTSLVVYPAAGLIRYYHGNKLVLINKSETQYDKYANLVLNMGLGEVFSKVNL